MYSMHKKTVRNLFCRSPEGFLLMEFIIAFALLSLAIMVCAHSFLSTIHEYSRAKERLYLFALAQNSIEFSWSGSSSERGFTDDRIKTQMRPVEHGIVLPNMPKLIQEWVDIKPSGTKSLNSMRLRGVIKEQ